MSGNVYPFTIYLHDMHKENFNHCMKTCKGKHTQHFAHITQSQLPVALYFVKHTLVKNISSFSAYSEISCPP